MKRKLAIVALGLAVTAVAVLAFGSTIASGGVCSKSGTGAACASGHGNLYGPQGFALSAKLATGKNTRLVSGFVNVNCTESSLGGKVTAATGGEGAVYSLTFGSCKDDSGETCTAESDASTLNSWPLRTKVGTAPSGTMEIENFTFVFTCFGTTCRYKAAAAGSKGEIVLTGGETATLTATSVPLSREATSGFLCSSTATWNATWSITTPDSFYLT